MSLLLPQEVVKKYPDTNSNLKKYPAPKTTHIAAVMCKGKQTGFLIFISAHCFPPLRNPVLHLSPSIGSAILVRHQFSQRKRCTVYER